MIPKVSKEQFIHAIINNTDNKNVEELSTEIGISANHFRNLRKKYKLVEKEHIKEIAQEYSLEQMTNLRVSAKEGNVKAMCTLLELAELYDPHKKAGEQGQMQVHFYISGLNVPKNAGLGTSSIPERTGVEVNIPESDYKIEEIASSKIDKSAEKW